MFLGGGNVGNSALTGMGATPRLYLGLNPAEAYFAPLAARQAAGAASADRSATFNTTLLRVGLAYHDLAESELRVAIAAETIANLEELVQLTTQFEKAGAGVAADTARSEAQLAQAQETLFRAREAIHVRSAELARLLRLDQTVILTAAEPFPLPVTLVPKEKPLQALVAQGIAARPEIDRQQFRVAEAEARRRQEELRPWVPNLYLGASAGGYGGGQNAHFADFDGRFDLDALAVWELENLGLGNQARERETASRQRQSSLEFQRIRDLVATQVAQAYHRALFADKRIDAASVQVESAARAVPLNFRGIRGGQLRPIEALQAIVQLATARETYLTAVIDHNRSQLRLLHAIGNVISGDAPAADSLDQPATDAPAPPPAPAAQ